MGAIGPAHPGDETIMRLRGYIPERHEPADFDAFWLETLADARSLAARRPPTFDSTDTPLRTIVVEDVTFPGFGGHPIRAWLLRPAETAGPLPAVVAYLGYGGGRSLPSAHLFWPSVGYAHLVMDSRGQDGETPDPAAGLGVTGHQAGWVTQGIDDPATYYYRRLMTDAVLALDAVAAHPLVDPHRIAVTGESQGGAIALAVAGLAPLVRAALIDVPFLCDIRHAVELIGVDIATGYGEIRSHLAWRRDRETRAFGTLSYFEGCTFAARATAPARFSTGLRDTLCPPATVFAAYNHYAGPRRIKEWPNNGHEGGGEYDELEAAAFLAELGLAP